VNGRAGVTFSVDRDGGTDCEQLMDGGPVSLVVSVTSAVRPNGPQIDSCAEALRIAQLIEPRLPKTGGMRWPGLGMWWPDVFGLRRPSRRPAVGRGFRNLIRFSRRAASDFEIGREQGDERAEERAEQQDRSANDSSEPASSCSSAESRSRSRYQRSDGMPSSGIRHKRVPDTPLEVTEVRMRGRETAGRAPQ